MEVQQELLDLKKDYVLLSKSFIPPRSLRRRIKTAMNSFLGKGSKESYKLLQISKVSLEEGPFLFLSYAESNYQNLRVDVYMKRGTKLRDFDLIAEVNRVREMYEKKL